MTRKVNAYAAVLVITIFGAGASLLIIHIANANTVTIFGSEDQQAAALGI